MKRTLVNPKEAQLRYDGYHFSQAVRVGETVWVSGQVGIDDLRGEIEEFTRVKDEFFPRAYPAWTAVGVTQLALPEHFPACMASRGYSVK